MVIRRFIVAVFSVGLMLLGAGVACGQDYPNKPIRIITSVPGSAVDLTARIIAQGVTGTLKQPVTVENRPPGFVPGDTVAKAPPDGYTLLCATNLFLLAPLTEKAPYDTVTDFSPITFAARVPNVLVVTSSLPVKSVKELIALAKARPGELNYSTTGTGGSSHLMGELLMAMAGINFVRVPYSNLSQQSADLVSGEVQLTITGVNAVAPLIKSGKLRGLAVTSMQPSTLLPQLPTLAASVPGYDAVNIYGILAPANTPATIINRLNQEIVRFLGTAEAKEKYLSAGLEVVGSSPNEFAAAMKSEITKWAKVIKDIGIKRN